MLIIVPKVTEYLCSGGFFFLQTSFDFLTSHFDVKCLYHSKVIVVLSLILNLFSSVIVFLKNMVVFKYRHFGQLGTINARYCSRC